MSTQTFKRIAVLSFVALFSTVACNQPADNNPTAPSSSAVNVFELIGPSNIAPGQPTQFSTSMRLADGTVKSGSTATDVRWRSSNTAVLQVSPTGLVTPVAAKGDAFITAELRVGTSNRTVTREVIVQPEGTFRLVGQIQELNAPGFQVADARVEVVGGSSVATSDSFGNYRLYGVPPTADIRISANAYNEATFSVQLSGNSTRNFALELISPRPTFAGNYTMLIDITSPCGFSPLPADLQHRSYEAVVTQAGVTVDVLLTSPQFRLNSIGRGNGFWGSLVPGGVRFTLSWYDSYYYPYYGPESYPNIAEQVSNNRYLVTQGTWNSTGSPGSGLTGTITNGGMLLWDSAFPSSSSRFLGGCFGTTTVKLIPR